MMSQKKMSPDRRSFLMSAGVGGAGFGVYGWSEAGSTARPVEKDEAYAREFVEAFGAQGDGKSDDTAAFEAAFQGTVAGGVLRLRPGQSYRLSRSLMPLGTITMLGGGKETTRLIFDNGTYTSVAGIGAALIVPHATSDPFGRGADARRSVFSGFSLVWNGDATTELCGALTSAPAYFYEIDVVGFPGDGFRVEAGSGKIRGNANGSSFINCTARQNRGDGFTFIGNNANACFLLGARSFDNGGRGFYDNSLIGNTYIATEVDGNKQSGYASAKDGPNRAVFIGAYAEPNQLYDLNPRNVVVDPLGHANGNLGSVLRGLPSGDLYVHGGIVFAGDENAAGTAGTGKPAALLRIGREGLDYSTNDGHRVQFTKLLSSNYVDVMNGPHPVIRLPLESVTGNVGVERAWMPNGLTIGGSGRAGFLGAGNRPPSTGHYALGAIWLNDAPRVGRFAGWICVDSGTPGKWQGFGRIEPDI